MQIIIQESIFEQNKKTETRGRMWTGWETGVRIGKFGQKDRIGGKDSRRHALKNNELQSAK